jgi:hypothetical protein
MTRNTCTFRKAKENFYIKTISLISLSKYTSDIIVDGRKISVFYDRNKMY